MKAILPDKILVVDDDPLVLRFLQQALTSDYEVFTATTALEAEKLLESHECKVLVCDDRMPGERGLDFLIRLRGRYPFLCRILLTGYADSDVLAQAINQASIFRYISKPVTAVMLRELVAEAVAEHNELRSDKLAAWEHRQWQPLWRKWKEGRLSPGSPEYALRILLTGLGILAFLFAVGVLLLILLYLLKTCLGIDFFEGFHLKDLF